ncbi:13789_t:CDS:10, partial [Rhizophagus irregularis]
MDPNQQDKDVMLAQLLSFGFDEWVCRKAIACNRTIEDATEVLNALDPNSGVSRPTTTLSLRPSSNDVVPMSLDTATSSSFPQPALVSRHSQPADESEYTKESRAKAVKAAEEAKKQKMMEREARNKALLAIKEDRIRNKQRKLVHQTSGSEESNIGVSSSTASQPETSSKPSQNTALIQIRLSTGQAIRQKFSSSTKISNLFEWVSNENEPSKTFQLMLPFPRKVFGDDQMDMTLADVGLVPNASLNVVKLDISPQQPQQPAIPVQPVIPNNIPLNVPSQAPPQISAQPVIPNNIPPNVPPHFLPQIPPQVPPQIPVIPNNVPPNFPPNFGQPPRIRALRGRFPPNIPRGMQPPPFSGGGHRLTDGPIIPQDSVDPNEEHVETEEEKRQRLADAIQTRVNTEENIHDNAVRQGIKRELQVESLKSKCAYCVAVLLTSATSVRIIRSLANVSSNIGELLVAELIKLNKLDSLTFRRFANCNLQNIILDNYPRATDSLLEVIGNTQRASVTRVSLRGCEVLTDTGLNGLQGLLFLESLDVSSCRVKDRALPALQGFENLTDLNLSKTKVTISGLRELFANCAFAKTLEVLDLSYCNGVNGRTVFLDLQPLVNIRSLNLDSTLLTPPQVPVNPSSFQSLEFLDISRTKLCDQDVMKILCGFKNLVDLNLTETTGIGQFGLKWMAKEYKSLNFINFPNREEELDDVLQDFSELPLNKLDLTNFINVTDVGILCIEAVKSLTYLSLSGTKLTDTGMTALKSLENLVELYLDRTCITDIGVANLRNLRELTHLSLSKTKIKNESLRIIGNSAFSPRSLKYLNVGYTRVTDKGVKELKGLSKLTFLNLDYTKVSLSCKQILAEMPQLQPRLTGITKEFCNEDD